MKILGTAAMQALEDSAIQGGVSVAALMEQAVEGCFNIILERWEKPRPVLVLAGKGHNGNDALVLAHRLRQAGWPVSILLGHPPEGRKPIPVESARGILQHATPLESELGGMASRNGKIVIDGLLGLGSRGPARGRAREILLWARSIRQPGDDYIALDFPSGLDADTGASDEATFPADFTFCLGAVKPGCLKDRARSLAGRIFAVPLPLLDRPEEKEASGDFFFTLREARQLARRLNPATHKYNRGVVALWAGSPGMAGAASLSATAALRAGAGLVKLWTNVPPSHPLPFLPPEVMTPADNALLLQKPGSALVIGPGLGRNGDTLDFFRQLLPKIQTPAVIDADALYLLAQDPGLIVGLRQDAVLTPHSGEMKRLRGGELPDRRQAAIEWTSRYPGVLVLKGPHSIVAAKGHALSFNASGNPGLATGGSGDVLSGILGTLLAQEYNPVDAARLAVFWHGLAGDLAARELTEQCVTASALIGRLPEAWSLLLL